MHLSRPLTLWSVVGLMACASLAAARGDVLFVQFSHGNIGEYSSSGATLNASLASVPLDWNAESLAVSGSDLFVAGNGAVAEYTTSGTLVNASLIPIAGAIAVSGSDLFVANGGTVGEYTTSGATINASLLSGLSYVNAIAVSGSDLFILSTSNSGNVSIGEYTTSGTTVNASLISGLYEDDPVDLAVSGSDIFVPNYNKGSISEYSTSGGTINPSLISGLGGGPVGIAISGSDLYVTIPKDGIGEYTTSGATVNASLVSGNFPWWIAVAPDVPEPSSLGGLALMSGWLLTRRRKT
ncbi:MAG: PEP-CTERM sorting domain-containing protein [Tepidisphaeraceae bacterium]|jgi:hypothetical protein